jgi:hypothetical protein
MGGKNSGAASGDRPVERSATTLLLDREDGSDGLGRIAQTPDAAEVLVVSATRSLTTTISDWRGCHGSLPAAFGLITFGEFDRSSATERGGVAEAPARRSLPGDDVTLISMSDPGNLQRLGTAVMLYLDDWTDTECETFVFVDALAPFVDASDVESTFQLLHLLAQSVGHRDATLVVRTDPSTTDKQTIKTFQPLFDAVIDRSDRDGSSTLAVETVHELLGNPRRRFVLRALFEDDVIDLDRLTTRLARWENETREPTDEEYSRAHVALASVHVPRLAEADLVRFDRSAGSVSLSDTARESDRLTHALDLDDR